MEYEVDWQRKYKERNISWMDYPLRNKKTGRKCQRTAGEIWSEAEFKEIMEKDFPL